MSESKATTGIETQCVECSQSMGFDLKQDALPCPGCSKTVSRQQAITEYLKTLMASTFNYNRAEIKVDSELREIGDSLSTIEMLMKVENEFGIMIGHEDIEELETVGEVAQYIDARLAVS